MTRREFDELIEKPYLYANLLGFDLITPFHNDWISKLAWRDEDYTLQAHRDSYKTTCLIVAVTMVMVLRPSETILLLRKESGSTIEFVRAVKRCLTHPITQEMAKLIYGHEVSFLKETQTELHTNLFKNDGAKESQLVADGVRSFAITGKHFTRIYTDDIVTLKDRISNAERIQTDNIYQELQNIRTKDGVILNTGTPWHKQDTFRLMPPPERYTIYDTGLFDEAGILKKKQSMTASLFSANYELKHVADEDCLFPNPKYEKYPYVDGIAHIDASYGGADTTALTIMCKKDGKLHAYGKIWTSHVQNHYNEILSLLQKYKAGTLYMERNADKGYLAKEFGQMWPNISTYSEHMNKHIKISTHLKSSWNSIYWTPETDPDYIEQIVDYQENQGHDDAPDSAACAVQRLNKGTYSVGDNMDGKTIKELIDSYTSTNVYRQMQLYYDLYMKRNPNLMERIRQRELKRRTPNWCVPTAYFSTVIDTHAGYLFSNVQYDSKNDEYEAHIQEILDANNVSVKDMKAGLNALTFNRAYELVYTVGDGENLKGTQIKFAPLDPLSVVPIYSDTIEPEIIAAVWFRESNGRPMADYITKDIWQHYEADEKKVYQLMYENVLSFSQCPVVEYRSEMIGDTSPFDAVVSYIEALDWAITGNSNEIDRIVDAILLLGKKLDPEDRDHLNEIKTLEDISKDEITPQFLEKNLSPEFRKYVTDLLIQEIYRHSHTVDWHTQMEGEASAKALKIKLFDMDMYSKRIEKVFVEGTQRRLDLIMELVRLRDNLQPEQFTISFERTLPTDNETLIQVLTGVDWISNQTKQEWVGLNSDIEQERLNGEAPMINLDEVVNDIQSDADSEE